MGKRKGKPKAKTKDEEGPEDKDTNCDGQKVSHCRKLAQTLVSQKLAGGHETKLVRGARSKSCKSCSSTGGRRDSFERELREKLEQVGETGPTLAPPLISISIAPASARASRSASCATTTNSTWSLKSIGKQRDHLDEEEEEEDRPEQVEETRPPDEQAANSRLGSVSSCEVFAPDDRGSEGGDVPPPPHPTTSGLEAVRSSYIRLVRHNSLQCFYLGTLVYSVICTILILQTSRLQPQPNDSRAANNCDSYDLLIDSETRANNSSNRITSGGGGGGLRFLLIALPSVSSLLAVIALKFFIELKRHAPARRRQQAQQQTDYFDSRAPRAQDTSPQTGGCGRLKNGLLLNSIAGQLPHYLQALAIHLCLWLIILPIGFVYYTTEHNDRREQIGDCEAEGEQPGPAPAEKITRHIPIVLLSVGIYLLPHLTSEIFTRAHHNHLRLLISTCLPAVIVIVYKGKLAEDFLLTLTMTALASLGGQLRHGHLMALAQRDTFEGASELIEAKVSLEQQRQQQETLLLSVLPAYVAEQVKRTMVKKMEHVRGDNEDEQQPAAPGASGQDNQQPVQVLVSTANATTQTVHGPAHCGRSLTLAGAAPGPELQGPSEPLASNNGTAGSQLKVMLVGAARDHRNSFARASRLSSSLASGAAYISEALLNNVHPISKSASTSSSAVQVTGPHVAIPQVAGGPPALLPVSSSLNMQQQQSRRGFNELYIRTYNNVSLLYGDIVGFTRLCTQLSSSQLVRVLNNLFSHFDHLAERHRIMRIKILGDCYYGVSGIPEFAVTGAKSSGGSPHRMHKMHCSAAGDGTKGATSGRGGAANKLQVGGAGGGGGPPKSDNHATNCVNMGLDMIQYIKRVNIGRATSSVLSRPSSGSFIGQQQQQQPPEAAVNQQLPDNFELNMRIGIHTGHIHSGVIGLKKWQFDVWSNDVSIAMHCESSGVAGRVQVTEATARHLRGAFALEPACTRSSRDTFLADRDINTYLIRERVQDVVAGTPTTPSETPGAAHHQHPTTTTTTTAPHEMADEDRIREATIGTIRQTLLAGDGGAEDGDPGAPSHPMSVCGLAELGHNDIRWAGLTFRDPTLNRQFDARQVGATRHALELLILVAVLAIALHLVDYLALVAPIDRAMDFRDQRYGRSIVVGGSLVGLCLLLVALPKPTARRPGLSATGGRSSYLGASSRAASLTQQQHKSSNPFMSSIVGGAPGRKSTRWSLANDGGQFVEDGRGALSSGCTSSRLVKLLSELPVARRWRHASQRKRSLRAHANRFTWLVNNRLTSGLILAAFLAAITSQAHLVARHLVCLGGTRELQQLSVFVVLMALDLSPSLWGHRTRCCLLIGVIALQVACLVFFVAAGDSPVVGDISVHFHSRLCPSGTGNEDSATGGRSAEDQPSARLIDLIGDAFLLVVALWSLAHQRQVECAQRCNFLWRNRLNVDHEELEYISGINKVLLENILPSHVVEHYLAQPATAAAAAAAPSGQNVHQGRASVGNRLAKSPSVASSASTQLVRMGVGGQLRGPLHSVGAASSASGAMSELYHEQHESVAVMFASIPHFYEFYDESDISKQGLGCIALLNEIICDFDKLLLKNKFSRIEKIKTIGSTYMAAAGLRPAGLAPTGASPTGALGTSGHLLSARNSTASQIGQQQAPVAAHLQLDERNRSTVQQQQQQLSQQKMNLICMIQFASSLMSALNGINKQSFQVFKLRVGVNAGPVIAGIIGAQRPFYDIWGDCVNIASRMESLGEVGRIQVEERTAKLLMECLCTENYAIRRRGPIDVKGKGGMVTYFVDKKEVPGQFGESCSRQSSASIAAAAAAVASRQSFEQQQVAEAANKQPSGGGQSDGDAAAAAASPAANKIRQQRAQQQVADIAAAAAEINGA